MIGRVLPVQVLTLQLIPNLSSGLAKALSIPDRFRAIGLISTDSDDMTYMALDEATKVANVEVVYARSLYAGAANASTALAGEVIGVLAGPTPAEVASGLRGAEAFLESGAGFRTANEEENVVYLAHCVSRTGSYLSDVAHVPVGQAIAYLIAPPVEAIQGLDAALKASDVELTEFFAPPTETNFCGGLLTGTQSACQAACDAFAEVVRQVAARPKDLGGM